MAFIAPIAAIAGTLFSGVAAMDKANYQAQVARNNAKIAERNAGLASQEAQTRAMRSDREYAAMRGQALATQGASGLAVASGSNQGVLGLIDRNRAEASTDLRTQGSYASENYNNQAAAFRGEANSAKSAGITSLIGAGFDAIGQGVSAFGGTKGKSRSYPWSN